MNPPEPVRVDKWLWAVRLYKTRSLAAEACLGGRVHIQGQPVKPARRVRIGEVIAAGTGDITRTVKVLALLDHRVGASLVAQFAEDLTPPAESARRRDPEQQPVLIRPKGSGRPTKKERRGFEEYFGD